MKNLNVNELGLEELSQKDARKINGGWFWIPIAIGLMLISSRAY